MGRKHVKKPDISKIKCKHGWRPWSIVCIHLLEGHSTTWIPLLQKKGSEQYDWLCPACDEDFTRMMKEHDLTFLRPVCIDCVEEIRSVLDRNCQLKLKEENGKTNTGSVTQRERHLPGSSE